MKLHRYFARRYAKTFFGVLALFFLLIAFLDLIDQVGRFSGTTAGFGEVVQMTLLNVPEGLYRILPLVTVLATIALFLALARSSEMVVTRAAGRSALTALLAPAAVSFGVGVLAVALFNPIVAATKTEYQERSNELRGTQASVLALSGDGLWLRQGSGDQQVVIRADAASLEGTELSGVTFVVITPEGGPVERIEATRAVLAEGAWELSEVKLWPLIGENPEAGATRLDSYTLPSSLTRDLIRDSFGDPSAIPIWELPSFISNLEQSGFTARRHAVWMHMELALPAFLVAMLLVAAGFTMRHQRGGGTGMMVMLALGLGFGLHFFRSFAQILGESGQVPVILAAWAPPVAALCLALGVLLHLEDG